MPYRIPKERRPQLDALVSALREKHFHSGLPDGERKILETAVGRLKKAFGMARFAHRKQWRTNGGEYFDHLLRVAGLAAENNHKIDTVTALFLHDLVEDGHASIMDVRRDFGASIADVVDLMTKPRLLDGELVYSRDRRYGKAQPVPEGLKEAAWRDYIVRIVESGRLAAIYGKLYDLYDNFREPKIALDPLDRKEALRVEESNERKKRQILSVLPLVEKLHAGLYKDFRRLLEKRRKAGAEIPVPTVEPRGVVAVPGNRVSLDGFYEDHLQHLPGASSGSLLVYQVRPPSMAEGPQFQVAVPPSLRQGVVEHLTLSGFVKTPIEKVTRDRLHRRGEEVFSFFAPSKVTWEQVVAELTTFLKGTRNDRKPLFSRPVVVRGRSRPNQLKH